MKAYDPAAAAHSLVTARRGGPRLARLDPPPGDTMAAYAVQEAVLKRLGDPGGVWKMALLGGTTREAAILPRACLYESGAELLVPDPVAIEVELALVLAGEPDPMARPAKLLEAVADMRLAFEFVSSRFSPQAGASPLESMADGFSSTAVILGTALPGWRDGLPDRLGIALAFDSKPIAVAEAPAPIAEALDFLQWLAIHARQQGRPLAAGDVIITGARVGPLALPSVHTVRADAMGSSVSARPRPV